MDKHQIWKHFEQFLKRRDLNVTQARHDVVRKIGTIATPFRSEDLVRQLSSGANRVSRATVYNTLSLLLDAGLITRVAGRGGRTEYKVPIGEQETVRFHCGQCGNTMELQSQRVERAILRQCEAEDLEYGRSRVEVWGICQECRDFERENAQRS